MIDKRKLGFLRMKGEKFPIEEAELRKAGIPDSTIEDAKSIGLSPVALINLYFRFGETVLPLLHQIVFDLKPVSSKLFQAPIWSFKTAPLELGQTILKLTEVNFSNLPAPGHQVYTTDSRIAIPIKDIRTSLVDSMTVRYDSLVLASGTLDLNTTFYLKGKEDVC